MSKLTLSDVQHVARLAALELDSAEAQQLCEQLGSILDAMAALEALDVRDVAPTSHPFDLPATLRPDRVQRSLPHEEALAAAPASEAGGFAVPKVLDGDS